MFLETKEVSRVFKESVKCVSRKFQVSRMYQESLNEVTFAICCMNLIAATRDEGGVVGVVFIFRLSS